jgi:pimeloyl-ACP methyl ester carboxylesterase
MTRSDLFIDDGGAGAVPVVFLHSNAGNTTHWAAQLEHLRPGRRALALDLPGHGRSPAPARWSIPDQAALVAAALDLPRFVLVGHSLGGALAVSLAGAQPERVAALLLLDPALDGRAIPADVAAGLMRALRSEDGYWPAAEAYWATLLEGATPENRARLMADLKATAPVTITEGLQALLTFDPVTPLRAYRGPRLSVTTAINDAPSAYHALVPDLPHRRVSGTSHWLQLDAPAEINRILDEVLAPLSRPPGASR